MPRLIIKILFLLLIPNAVYAAAHSGATATQGSTQVNIGTPDLTGGLLNAFKNLISENFQGTSSPANLDALGYPISIGSGDISWQILVPSSAAFTGSTLVNWIVKWPVTRTMTVFFNDFVTWVSDNGNCTVTHAVNATMTVNGSNCRVVFFFNTAGNISGSFPQTGTYAAGSGDAVLCRATDELVLAAGGIFTPEYLNIMRSLHPKEIRNMPWINQNGANVTNQSQWAYRAIPTNLSYQVSLWPPGILSPAAITGTDAYTITAATNTLTTWTAGEPIIGKITNSATNITISGAASNGGNVQLTVNASGTLTNNQSILIYGVSGTTEANGIQTILTVDSPTLVTLNVPFVHAYSGSGGVLATQTLSVTNKTGAKFIVGSNAQPMFYNFAGSTTAGNYYTFIYDDLLDKVIFTSSGITGNVPIEVSVALANAIYSNLWVSIPYMADNNYTSSLVNLVATSLNAPLNLYVEYSNEVWNPGFPQTGYATLKGAALNFPLANNEQAWGWYGLRFIQISQSAQSAWLSNNRTANSLKRVLAFQAFGDATNITYRFNGTDLNTGLGYTKYNSYVNANYFAAPNRPIDYADVMSYANYYTGANFLDADSNYAANCTSGNGCVAFLQNLANLQTAGDSASITTALNLIDNDIRQGTTNTKSITSASTSTFTLNSHGYSNNQIMVLTTTGTLYTGASLVTPYYITAATANTFQLVPNYGGSTSISVSGGTGTQAIGNLGGGQAETLLNFSATISLSHGNTNPPGWENTAATYDSVRATYGKSPLVIELYEGGLNNLAPSSAECTSLGITIGGSGANASTALTNILTTYKNTALYAVPLTVAAAQQLIGSDPTNINFGLMPHTKTPSELSITGGGQWALMPGDITSTPYQTFNGVADFTR